MAEMTRALLVVFFLATISNMVWAESCPALDSDGIPTTVTVTGEPWTFIYNDFSRQHSGNTVHLTLETGEVVDFTGNLSDFHWSDDLGGIEWLLTQPDGAYARWYPDDGRADFFRVGDCFKAVTLYKEEEIS